MPTSTPQKEISENLKQVSVDCKESGPSTTSESSDNSEGDDSKSINLKPDTCIKLESDNTLLIGKSLVISRVTFPVKKDITKEEHIVSFKKIYYGCNIIRNHSYICNCLTPRLHIYIMTGHQCQSTCRDYLQMETNAKSKLIPEASHDEMIKSKILESEVSENEMKEIVKGESIFVEEDDSYRELQSPNLEDKTSSNKQPKRSIDLGNSLVNRKKKKSTFKIRNSLFKIKNKLAFQKRKTDKLNFENDVATSNNSIHKNKNYNENASSISNDSSNNDSCSENTSFISENSCSKLSCNNDSTEKISDILFVSIENSFESTIDEINEQTKSNSSKMTTKFKSKRTLQTLDDDSKTVKKDFEVKDETTEKFSDQKSISTEKFSDDKSSVPLRPSNIKNKVKGKNQDCISKGNKKQKIKYKATVKIIEDSESTDKSSEIKSKSSETKSKSSKIKSISAVENPEEKSKLKGKISKIKFKNSDDPTVAKANESTLEIDSSIVDIIPTIKTTMNKKLKNYEQPNSDDCNKTFEPFDDTVPDVTNSKLSEEESINSSSRKLLFQINKTGTFHSFNQNFLKISSVSTLLDSSEEITDNKIANLKCEENEQELSDRENNPMVQIHTNVKYHTTLEEHPSLSALEEDDNSIEIKIEPDTNIKPEDLSDEEYHTWTDHEQTAESDIKIKSEETSSDCPTTCGEDNSNNILVESSPKHEQFTFEEIESKVELIEPDKAKQLPELEKLVNCSLCMITFPNFTLLLEHLLQHQKDGLILCYYCQKCFGDKTTMKRHVRTHTGEKPYQCKICFKRFSLPGNFKKHRDIHADIRTEPCDICGKMFRRKEHLKQHKLTHTGEKPFKCSLCNSCFTARYSLQIHMNIHLGRKPFKCSYCGKGFADKSTMTKHIRVHTGERPFSCKVCEKTFGESGALTAHATTHSQDRPYECTQCSLSFKTSKGLRQHMKIHFGDKQFSCKYCGMMFIQKYNMLMHERIHTGEKPYECSECNRTFRSRSCLGKHIVLHGGELDKKYSCNYCEKKFHRKAHLKRHISTHLGVKEHQCDICFKKFSIKSSLKKHLQTFHSEGARSFPCLKCGRTFKRSIYVATHKCSSPVIKEEPND